MSFRKLLIKLFHLLQQDHQLDYLRYLETSSMYSYDEHLKIQFHEVKKLLSYSYDNVPFYKYWFDLHNVDVSKISSFSDFSRMVPVLTKKDIIENYALFSTPPKIKYITRTTGGSTGQTLKYRISKKDLELGMALLLRGMGVGGYRLGDRILILAGGSLVKRSSRFKLKLIPKLLNQYKISSYGLEPEDLHDIVRLIRKKNINYLRGYASSIYCLADYCKNHSVSISFKAVFSTAERLLDQQRLAIENAFKCKVYNQYGLNDGSVSAYEQNEESGLVVDMERAYLEMADNGTNEAGMILATSFYNYAFPFIRYDTGDRGILEIRDLKSGVKRPVLTKLLGRETEYLIINNKKIAGPVLTVLMGKTNAEQYRIIQKTKDSIEIQIKKGENYSKKDEDFIIESFKDNCGPDLSVTFKYKDSFPGLNKHKFIINEANI